MTSLNETPDPDRLLECREFFAAGFFRETESSTFVRMAQAVAWHQSHMELPPWQGTRLYPGEAEVGGPSSNLYSGHSAVYFHYAVPMGRDGRKLEQKIEEAGGQRKQALCALQAALGEYPYFSELGGWIHASVNFRRILSEGLNSYGARIRARQADARKTGQSDKLAFYDAMQITLDGIRRFHTRVMENLGAVSGATPIRSLPIDDCIDRGIEYHAGGARYNWSVVTIGSIANAADSLQSLREVVSEQKELSSSEMLQILKTDFKGKEDVRLRLAGCARYGNDDARTVTSSSASEATAHTGGT